MKLKRPPTSSLVIVGLVLSVLIGRAYAYHRLQRSMLKVRPQSQKTPLQYGAPYEELSFPSEWRTLKSFYVAPPPGEHKAAVLIFHGNDESIASWSPVQGYLYQHGLGSMVFDYSGFGHSDGTPTIDHARADGLAAWAVFKDHLPPGTRACGYGLSLGTGVLSRTSRASSPRPIAWSSMAHIPAPLEPRCGCTRFHRGWGRSFPTCSRA